MLIIDRSVITDGGAALLNSGDPINITSIKTGSGSYTSTEDIKSRTALKSTQYSYAPSSVVVDGATRSVKALLSNYDPVTQQAIVTSDYTITEVGMFATVNGADVLFAIGVSYTGTLVPAYTGDNKSEIVVTWDMGVSGTDSITITASGAAALAVDFNNHVDDMVYTPTGVHGIRAVLDGNIIGLQVKDGDEWKDAGGGVKHGTASISPDTITVKYATPTVTATLITNSDGVPTVTSSDENVVTATINGTTITITGVSTGTATITVSIPETEKYTACEATATVTAKMFPELVIGNTYFFGGHYWTAAEQLAEDVVCIQSQGMTMGAWPAYKLTRNYDNTKNYGNANTGYNGAIDGDNIANYDTVTQTWYTKYSSAEKTGQAYGSGLFLVSNEKCNQTTSGQQGSGNYWSALKTAATNYSSFGASYDYAWIGTVYSSNYAWLVNSSGEVNFGGAQANSLVVAPAFNLDLEKVDLIDGSWLLLRTEEKPNVYGALWDGTSTTALSRTDDAATFVDPSPAVNNGDGSSPFDACSPWKDIKRSTDSSAGTLVEIPKFWYKWTVSGATIKLQIADGPAPGFNVAPAFMARGDGKGIRDKVYVGAYHCATSTYKSTTGVKPQTSATRASVRTSISGLGSTIYQWDYAMLMTLWMLYIVEYANWNSQTTIGYGCGNGSSIENMGSTDGMTYHTGTNAVNRTTYGHVRYRYIEDLWGNVFDWCDGIYFSGADIYIIKNPSSFSDSTGGTKVGTRPTTAGYISAWAQSAVSGYDWFMHPSAVAGSDSTYVPDYCNNNASGVVLLVGGNYAHSQLRGLFCLNGDAADSYAGASTSSRLMKL